jgi:hypothetical protein
VVVVRSPRPDATLRDTFNRLQAELNLQLFEVSLRDACAAEPCPSLPEVAKTDAADAVIQLNRIGTTVSAQLCVWHRQTGDPELRELTSENGPDTAAVIAIRSVDLLRERLRVPFPKPAPTTPLAPSSVTIPRPVSITLRTIPRNSLRIGMIGAQVAERVSPLVGGGLTFERRIHPSMRVGIEATQTFFGGQWRDGLGTASLSQTVVLAQARFVVLDEQHFQSWLVAGAGVHNLRANASVRAPLEARSDSATAWTALAGAGFAFNLWPRLALEFEPTAMAVTPKPTIAIVEHVRPFWWVQLRALAGVRVSF